MEEKTLKLLEFDKILTRLSEHASSEAGQLLCNKLTPSTSYRRISTWQKNTTDAARRVTHTGSAPDFRGVRDLSGLLRRLEAGGVLSASELLKVSSVLTIAERTAAYGDTENEDSLTEMFSMITPLAGINREIKRCVIDEDVIADDASAGLMSVRRSMKKTADSVHDVMQGKLNACRDYLTDAVITQRDGRYCLPVKAEYKSKVPGMVHDVSSTGMTLFIEPMAVVELNNRLRELEIQEKKEIELVLKTLSGLLSPNADAITDDIRLLGKLDMIFAKALYSLEYEGTEPVFAKSLSIDLKQARHPLIDKNKVVPIDVRLGTDFDLLVVTGPNTGGKTVSLKTTGLLALMAQAGLHIPAAEDSRLGIFDEIYADIGDEQSIEQSLSTFSAHMTNIVNILGKADARSLCLFDELGSGTDPTEGAALAMAILDFLHRMKTRTMATTHYSEIKMYALETDGVENACCEFDVESLRPTYRLLTGVPGKSNAFAISKRLGLPDFIIDDARNRVAAENENFEDVITRLNETQSAAAKAKAEAESYRHDAEILKERLKKKEARLEEGREKILSEARQEAQRILKDAKETADSAIRTINKIGTSGSKDTAKAESERAKINKGIKDTAKGSSIAVKGPSRPVSPKKLRIGDEVRLMPMGGMTGTVTSLPDKDGNISVQLGFMTSRVSVKSVELADAAGSGNQTSGTGGGGTGGGLSGGAKSHGAGKPAAYQAGYGRDFGAKALTVSPEVNLIGLTTDDALPKLEKYLDDAYLAGLKSVRVVHGRGTGALKSMVHQYLRRQTNVESYRLGEFGEGDTGVTIVTFK